MGAQATDSILVERVQQGDKKAFDLLVQKYQNRIVKLISRYISDPSETLDVAQEAFIKAYRALPNFRGDSAFYTWLYRIAINTAKNALVAKGRRPPNDDVNVEDAIMIDAPDSLRDSGSPEQILMMEEMKQVILKAIEKLPEELKTAITLRELEGLSYEEIAAAMECPIGTVRSRIFRAREAIDRSLKPLLAE